MKRRGSILGRLLARLAPSWALKRARSRALLEAHYDAAARSRRTDGWGAGRGDANAVRPRTLQRLRDLSRDLVRNNPSAKRARSIIASHTVGTGITATAKADDPAVEARANELWERWEKNPNLDYDQQLNFIGIQRLVMKTLPISGAALVLRERANSSDGLPVPLRIRVVEPDHVDHGKDSTSTDGNPIVQGIETDGSGRRLAYWIFPTHPGARSMRAAVSERVPAEDVIHIYDVDRPGQLAGVPWMDAVITTLNTTGDFQDAERMLMVVASMAVGVVEDLSGANVAVGEEDEDDPLIEHLEPGAMLYLGPNQTVRFNQPPTPAPSEFVADAKREIFAAMGITYEAGTGDYRKATFSSARMARQEHRNNVNEWRDILIPKLCEGVWRWFMELAVGLEGWSEVPTAEWIAPPLPSVEPDKEPAIFRDEIRSGYHLPSQALRKRGIVDFDRHTQKFADEMAVLHNLGIVWDSDASQVTGAGIKQAEDQSESQ